MKNKLKLKLRVYKCYFSFFIIHLNAAVTESLKSININQS